MILKSLELQKNIREELNTIRCKRVEIMEDLDENWNVKEIRTKTYSTIIKYLEKGRLLKETIESIIEGGKPLSKDKIQKRQEKLNKVSVEQNKKTLGLIKEKEKRGSFSVSLTSDKLKKYKLTIIGEDIKEGHKCWKIKMEPLEENMDIIEGICWIEIDSNQMISMEGKPAKNPPKIKSMSFRILNEKSLKDLYLTKEIEFTFFVEFLLLKKRYKVKTKYEDYELYKDLDNDFFTK